MKKNNEIHKMINNMKGTQMEIQNDLIKIKIKYNTN